RRERGEAVKRSRADGGRREHGPAVRRLCGKGGCRQGMDPLPRPSVFPPSQAVGWVAGRPERVHFAFTSDREDACQLVALARLQDFMPTLACRGGIWRAIVVRERRPLAGEGAVLS